MLADVGDGVAEGQPLARIAVAGSGEQLIVSPRAGTITSQSLALGQAVVSGTPVARVLSADAAPLEPVAYVTPDIAGRVTAGMEASITPVIGNGSAQRPPQRQP